MFFDKLKLDWVYVGGIILGGIVGIFLLHTVVPVTKVAKDDARKIPMVSGNPFDAVEGWNWGLDTEKIAKNYTRDATQSPYWKNIGNEYYSPNNVY